LGGKWKSLADTSRTFLVSSANASTGLHPDYATFAGAPTTAQAGDGHDQFAFDAWRVVMNMAVDYAHAGDWSGTPSASMKAQVNKYHTFFASYLGTNNLTQSLFHVDGSSPCT
jgi:endo-1,4-beta-D-glucanase Y